MDTGVGGSGQETSDFYKHKEVIFRPKLLLLHTIKPPDFYPQALSLVKYKLDELFRIVASLAIWVSRTQEQAGD